MTDKFDGLFMTGVQQAQGIDNYFDCLFSFFARKTDFFSQEERAMTTVNQYLTKHIGLFQQEKAKQEAINKQKEVAKEKAAAERAAKEAASKATVAADDDDNQVCEVTEEEAALIEAQEAARKANPGVAAHIDSAQADAAAEEEAKGEENKEEEAKGAVPNSGNGGSTDKYSWEQTLQEVTVNVVIPEGTTSKQLTVDIAKTHLKVGLKGQPLMIDGELHKQVKKSDSIWCIETMASGERMLQISLTKKDQQNWWTTIIVGDEEINTQKIEPENSKLSDLDGDTRGVVEKMMYDQRQKQAGLPTADEQQKKGQLDAFMKAHPEMDFSKAKFC